MPTQRLRSGRARGRLWALPLVVLLPAAGTLSCAQKRPPPSLDVTSPQSSPDSIPDAPLSGKIHGAPFKLADARYYVDQRRGFEKVDILLGGASVADRCGPSNPKEATSVWLRRLGGQPIAALQATGLPRKPSPWEVHYQARSEESWVGNGDSAYLLVIREVRPDKTIVGDLSVCFADYDKSCVSGSFEAYYCPIAIDASVRGTEPPEPIPAKWKNRAAPSAAPASSSAEPATSASAEPATSASATTNVKGALPEPAGGTKR